MYAELAQALLSAEADSQTKVVLIQGHETVFSAGNDIADFLQQPAAGEDSPVFRFLRGIAVFTNHCWPRFVGQQWVWVPPCCCIAIWFMRGITLRFLCRS